MLHLMRAGVDAELLWTGTDEACGYGLIDKDVALTPLFHIKRLFAHYVPYGDWVRFPQVDATEPLSVVSARGNDGRRSTLLIHTENTPRTINLSQIDADLDGCDRLLMLDPATNGDVTESPCDGKVVFRGWGVAVVTNTDEQKAEQGETPCG